MRALRLSHFPPSTYQENQFGLAPHTDANFFTVLPQAIVERLYIRPQGRGWLTPVLLHPACRLPDCLPADMLQCGQPGEIPADHLWRIPGVVAEQQLPGET